MSTDVTKIGVPRIIPYLHILPFPTGETPPPYTTDTSLAETDWTAENWIALPTVSQDTTIQFAEESEDIHPLHEIFRTHDVITALGVEEVNMMYDESDTEAFKYAMSSSVESTVAAATGTTGYRKIVDGGFTTPTYYQLAFHAINPSTGFDKLFFIKKVRAIQDQELTFGHTHLVVPAKFKGFALSTEAATEKNWAIYNITTAAV